jgi:hypothetical protein
MGEVQNRVICLMTRKTKNKINEGTIATLSPSRACLYDLKLPQKPTLKGSLTSQQYPAGSEVMGHLVCLRGIPNPQLYYVDDATINNSNKLNLVICLQR